MLHCHDFVVADILGGKARQFLQTTKTAGESQLSKVGICCVTNPKCMALAFAALLAKETMKSKLLFFVLCFRLLLISSLVCLAFFI